MLPEGLTPEDFQAGGSVYEGWLAFAHMPRISPMLAEPGGEAWARLQCGIDTVGRRALAGQLEASVPLQCQRCLTVYYHPVAGAFEVTIVGSEEEGNALPEELEPFVSESAVRPLEVVEEELLLALPFVARHPEAECGAPENRAGVSREELSPFAGLRGMVRQEPEH